MDTKKTLATAVLLAAGVLFPKGAISPGIIDPYEKVIYIASAPVLETRMKSEDAVIVIDPGHDDKFVGRHVERYREEVINLDFSRRLAESIEDMGGKVYLTRDSTKRMNIDNLELDDEKGVDAKDELTARANYLKKINPDFSVIVHQNYYPSASSVNGLEIYVFGIRNERQLEDDKLNYTQISSCRRVSGPSLLVARRLEQYLVENGHKTTVFGSDMKVLQENPDKVVLYLEMGYMSNRNDLKNIIDPDWQDDMARLLARFFEENIDYIKRLNDDYALKKNLAYILKPQAEKDTMNLLKMMKESYGTKESYRKTSALPPLEQSF